METKADNHESDAYVTRLSFSELSNSISGSPAKLSATFAFAYSLLHILVELLIIQRFVNKDKLRRMSFYERVNLGEKLSSTINGLVLGISGLKMILFDGAFNDTRSIFHEYPPELTTILSSYVGYTAYDLTTMLLTRGDPVMMWVHHLLGFGGAYFSMKFRRAVYFPTAFLISEITVFGVNIVWLMRIMGWIPSSGRSRQIAGPVAGKRSPQQIEKLESIYRKLVFFRGFLIFIFRTFLAPLCLYHMWNNIDKSSKLSAFDMLQYQSSDGVASSDVKFNSADKLEEIRAKWLIILRECRDLPTPVLIGTLFNVSVFGGMNAWWSYLAIKALLNRRNLKHVNKKKKLN